MPSPNQIIFCIILRFRNISNYKRKVVQARESNIYNKEGKIFEKFPGEMRLFVFSEIIRNLFGGDSESPDAS